MSGNQSAGTTNRQRESILGACAYGRVPALFLLVLTMVVPVRSEELPNGEDSIVTENAVNIPVSRILLAKRGGEYCAMKLLTSNWQGEASDASYVAYYAPNAASLLSGEIAGNTGAVHMKPPLRILGRFAVSRSQETISCGKIGLQWSGAPNNSDWIYLDEEKSLQLAPTAWTDIRSVNPSDPKLRWFTFGDVHTDLRIELGPHTPAK